MPSETDVRPWWRRVVGSTWFPLAATIIGTALILSFVAKPYSVPSGSMEETLEVGDRILVNRLAYVGASPVTGDIIVFDAGDTWGSETTGPANPLLVALAWLGEVTGFGPSGPSTLVKRVIGAPGQTVECCTEAGEVTVDGEPLAEPYVSNDFAFVPGTTDCDTVPASQRCFGAVTVPDDSYLVLGDNRAGSADSAVTCRFQDATDACWRWAPRAGVVGKSVAILWPIVRWSTL